MKKDNITTSSLKQIIIRLAEIDLDEDRIRHITGINKSDFEKLKEDKLVKSAFKKFVGASERLVEQALLKCATGFEYEEATGASGSAKNKRVSGSASSPKFMKKTVLPNVTACMFWLKNRVPERWRDTKDISDKEKLKDFIEKYGEE